MVKKILSLVFIVGLLIGLVACGGSDSASNDSGGQSSNGGGQQQSEPKEEPKKDEGEKEFAYPEETLNWTIAFGPGGGNDIMSRTIIDILKKYDLYTEDIIAENRKGGSGAVGWGYLDSNRGNPYHISSTSGSFINTPLVSDVSFNYKSFTPVALMATDDMVFLVHGDAKWDSMEAFIEDAKKAGDKKLTIGGIGAVNVDAMIPKMLAEKAGFEFEYVPFQGAGELTSALLSKSIDGMMSNPAEILGQIDAGKMKPLAFSGMKRIPQLPDTPTFQELGYDVTLPMPRGVVLAGDVPKEVQEWWIKTLKEVATKPEWKAYIEENSLTEYQIYGDEFGAYLEKTSGEFERILKELGAL